MTISETITNPQNPVESHRETEDDTPLESLRERPYNVRDFWYPVVFLQDFLPDRPYGFSIYDESYVLFVNSAGELECLRDRCPHRSAKLSDGKLIDGKIECLYHGWQFGKGGECLHIPQLSEGGTIPKAACARSFPVAVRQGLVWIWLGNPQAANAEEISTLEVLETPGVVSSDYLVDLPYDRTYLIENVIDPAHVNISHDHSEPGVKKEDAQPLEMEILDRSGRGIFTRYRGMRNPNDRWKYLDFVAQNLVHYRLSEGIPHFIFGLGLYSLPLGKGRCRLFVRRYSNAQNWQLKYKPRWMEHLRQSQVLEEDLPQIVGQQEEVSRSGESLKSLYLPLKTSDALVVEYRKWLDEFGETLPFYEGYETSRDLSCASETVSLDRFSRHTQNCSSCSQTYHNLEMLKRGAIAVSIILAAVAIVLDDPRAEVAIVLVALASVAAATLIQKLKTHFERSYQRF
ncbi:MAG TPA: Rieske 2Fe-2S domain-containing protein [Oscillatoriales cyanobacterium M4454_W2019_049]|nr:Rieske 2Fe-2S domain-containing protein [Oscillatoriales cyanobacterium M4454_W2019_049]